MMRWFLLTSLTTIMLLGAVVLFNTWWFTAPPTQVTTPIVLRPTTPVRGPMADSAVAHLRRAIRLRTVSPSLPAHADTAALLAFHHYIERTYPLLHAALTRETVGRYSLLYRWAGTNQRLAPVVLLAHFDVVPVEDSTTWRYPPFAGVLHAGQIWGRGAVDNKVNVIAQLESIEHLLRSGSRPARTVYFFFGHDEELGGSAGAAGAAQLLHQRDVRPAFILDEGGFVTTQKVPGMQGRPVALVGTAEKGYLSLRLSAALAGGHSSMPESVTALDLVAQALIALRGRQFPARLTPAMQDFARYVGPNMPFVQRMAFANQWLFRPLILNTYTKTAAGAAAVRTTLVPTVFAGGLKDNVVPAVASATVNLRLLPGTSVAASLTQVRAWLPDKRVQVAVIGQPAEPTPTASTAQLGYQLIAKQLRQQQPRTITTPFLFIAQSDSRHFLPLTPNIYRFSPFTDPYGFHAVDEHVSVTSYQDCLRFYEGLLGQL